MAANQLLKGEHLYLKGKELFRAGTLTKALKLITKAADCGYDSAMYFLAYLYKNGRAEGIEVPKDPEKAFYWMKKTAEYGYASAAYDCATMDPDKNNWVYWMEKAAKRGLKGAAYELACYYYDPNDDGSQKDTEKAIYWFGAGAQQEDCKCQYEYAQMYRNGVGTTKDPEKAFYWMEKAVGKADRFFPDPQYEYAKMLYKGEGCARDLEKAWDEMKKVAVWYKYKDSDELSEEYFFAYQEKLAESGDEKEKTRAWYELGHCYEEGCGIEQDYAKAAYWYEKAAKEMYAHGSADLNCAIFPELFKAFGMSYDHEYEIQAQKKLATLYYEGKGVEQDYLKAYYWLELAARMGDEDDQSIEEVRQKVWDLKEETINRIYADCIDNEGIDESYYLEDEVLSPELIEGGSGKYRINKVKTGVYSIIIYYMFGQLKAFHSELKPVMSFEDGFINYQNESWTEERDTVLKLYALGDMSKAISEFYKMEDFLVVKRNPNVVPTYFTGDPKYPEWYKEEYRSNSAIGIYFESFNKIDPLPLNPEMNTKPTKERLKEIVYNYWCLPPKGREELIEELKQEAVKSEHVTEKIKNLFCEVYVPAFLKNVNERDLVLFLAEHKPNVYPQAYILSIFDSLNPDLKKLIVELDKQGTDYKTILNTVMEAKKTIESYRLLQLLCGIYGYIEIQE